MACCIERTISDSMKGRSSECPSAVGDGAEIARLHVLGQLGRDAQRVQRLEQHVELFLFGFAVHAVQRADATLPELARHRDIRQDHALLDELVRLVALVADTTRWMRPAASMSNSASAASNSSAPRL